MEYNNLPELSGWATLKAVVEKGGVAAAATALDIGQPAVTKRLRALEESYGIALTERVAGRLRLTEAGEKVYLLAVQTLDRQRALYHELQNLVQGQNSMRLEVTFTIGEVFLPELLLSFSELYPQYRVDSRMAYSRKIQSDLATGLADLALLESAPDHPDILVQKWQDDELWLVCGSRHPATGTDFLPVEKLPELKYVLREKGASSRDELDESMRRIGISQLPIAMEVGSTDTIIEMLDRGKHVSFLPRFAVLEKVSQGELFHIKVSGFRIMRTLWIARHRNKLEHPVAENFVAMMRS